MQTRKYQLITRSTVIKIVETCKSLEHFFYPLTPRDDWQVTYPSHQVDNENTQTCPVEVVLQHQILVTKLKGNV